MPSIEVLNEHEYQQHMDRILLDFFADSIPHYPHSDMKRPEWEPTPIVEVDLGHYGHIYVKNEANTESNPTATIKDRAAWELTTLYRDFAQSIALREKAGILRKPIEKIPIPRFSLITAGNFGHSIAFSFQKYSLPPPKFLVSERISESKLEFLKSLYADIYVTDLSKASLTPVDICSLTNNANGIDITSTQYIEPAEVFYDWHVHEALNESPDEIYVPFGSGRLWENYLYWQAKSLKNAFEGEADPRLRIPIAKVANVSILGGEPEARVSLADKLTKDYNPFLTFTDQAPNTAQKLQMSGENTGVYRIPEEKIEQAHAMLSQTMPTEPSASAGLALYLHRFEEGRIDPAKKHLIVNTGHGASDE